MVWFMRKKSQLLSFFISVIFTIMILSNMRVNLVDDAFIFKRYAFNLAHYGQLVFNPVERAEGITSILWTFLIFINERFIHGSFPKYVTALSLLILFILSLRIWYVGTKLSSASSGLFCVLFLLSQNEFLASSTNGLEGVLFGYLLFELIHSFWEEKTMRSFIIGGILYLTRPEALFIVLMMLFFYLVPIRNIESVLRKSLAFWGIVIGVTLFRVFYYGEFIPNSVIAKSIPLNFLFKFGTEPALKYIIGFIKNNLLVVFVFLMSVFHIGFIIRQLFINKARGYKSLIIFLKETLFQQKDTRSLLLGFFIVFFSLLATLRNGGDWMFAHRLLSQYLPLYMFMMVILIKNNVINKTILASLGTLSVILLLAGLPTPKIGFPKIHYGSDYYKEIAQRIKPSLEPQDLVSAEAIGYISHLLPNQPIFDPLGLTNPYIARNGKPLLGYGKVNIPYLVQTIKPAILIWHWGGHLYGNEILVQENYAVFCKRDCNNLDADLVLIRKDIAGRFKDAFMDWNQIEEFSKVWK